MLLKISQFVSIDDYEPWSGAVPWWEEVGKAGKQEALWELICQEFSDQDEVDWTQINDFVWFEPEYYYPLLGMEIEG